jgi:hypothetical protein
MTDLPGKGKSRAETQRCVANIDGRCAVADCVGILPRPRCPSRHARGELTVGSKHVVAAANPSPLPIGVGDHAGLVRGDLRGS